MDKKQANFALRRILYERLCKAAESKSVTPTNAELMEGLGRTGGSAKWHMEVLVREGLIKRLDGGAIMIVETKKRTRPNPKWRDSNSTAGARNEKILSDLLRSYVGKPIPTNKMLCKLTGMTNTSAVSSAIAKLKIKGIIEFDIKHGDRILTMLNVESEYINPFVEYDPPRVDSRLCPRCGVKAESHEQFGCSRRMAA